jgi:hypothetical protein
MANVQVLCTLYISLEQANKNKKVPQIIIIWLCECVSANEILGDGRVARMGMLLRMCDS